MSFLFDTPNQVNEGPKLDNLMLPRSEYGDPIRRAFGLMRMSAQVIWGLPLREEQITAPSTGGKKGRVTNVSYLYYATFAASFAHSVASEGAPRRIWANRELIYDRGVPGAIEVVNPLIKPFDFRFYRGTKDQEPDPLILQEIGKVDSAVPVAPAYRDQCYIVFENMLLKDYGNRLPEITAEIAFGGDAPADTTGSPFGRPFPPLEFQVQLVPDEDMDGNPIFTLVYSWAAYPNAVSYEVSYMDIGADVDASTLNPMSGTIQPVPVGLRYTRPLAAEPDRDFRTLAWVRTIWPASLRDDPSLGTWPSDWSSALDIRGDAL